MNILYAVIVLGVLAIVFGLILAVAAKVFEVEVDPRLPEIQAALAGANCGGCGYPGCGGCAEAILAGKMVAHVLCNGGCKAKDNFEYRGVSDCLAATKVCGGNSKACRYGCFGFGMCERTCKFDAIHVVNNVAVIDYSKCKNCTMCAKACPRNAIEPIPTPEEKEKFKAAQKAAAEKKAAAAKAAAEAAKTEAPKAE